MDRLDEIRRQLSRVPDPLALLEGFFAHAPVALQLYESGGRCILTNQAFRELFGTEPPPEYNVLVDEIAAERGILDQIRRAFAGEAVTTAPIWYDPRELRQVRITEGRRVAAGAHIFPLFDRDGRVAYVALIFKDVTAEREAREQAESAACEAERERTELAISEARFRSVFEHAGFGITFGDLEGGGIQYNPALKQMLGYESEELERLGIQGVTHPDDYAADLEQFRRLLRGEIDRYEMDKRYIHKNGSTVWARLCVTLGHDSSGAPRFAVGMVQDITARRQARQEREQLRPPPRRDPPPISLSPQAIDFEALPKFPARARSNHGPQTVRGLCGMDQSHGIRTRTFGLNLSTRLLGPRCNG